MREAQKGNKNRFCKTHSEESKNKISEAQKGKTHSEVSKAKISKARGTAVKVLDLETDSVVEYPSMNKAAEALGVTQSALSKRFGVQLIASY